MKKDREKVHLLFTADRAYAARIPVVLESVRISHPDTAFYVHLISDSLPEEEKVSLLRFCRRAGYSFSLYSVPEDLFSGAPVVRHYSRAMYYRLLAGQILPSGIKRVIYLDPDILVINSLLPLWETDLEGKTFAAASHTQEEGILDNINRLRLETAAVYFNTGVLLIDLERCRRDVKAKDIFGFIEKNEHKLMLPDQDVFNALYGYAVKEVPDEIWNYDARKFSQYMIRSGGVCDENWIIRNTAVLHFCGKEKPWQERYRYRFGVLYKHYEWLTAREEGEDR